MSKFTFVLSLSLCVFSIASISALTSCSSGYQQESTGQYVDSSVITAKIKTKLLAEHDIKSLPITVTTYKNIVQLSGFVDDNSQRLKAVEIARNVEGVKAVQNLLVVKKS